VLGTEDADAIVAAFALGEVRSLTGPVARGEQGQVWRLEMTRGAWAVKETFDPPDESAVAEGTAVQEAAALAGIATPQVARTTGGDVLHACRGTSVRVYQWVDLGPPDRLVDPAVVGLLLAAIHRLDFEGVAPSTRGTSTPWGQPAGTNWQPCMPLRRVRTPAS